MYCRKQCILLALIQNTCTLNERQHDVSYTIDADNKPFSSGSAQSISSITTPVITPTIASISSSTKLIGCQTCNTQHLEHTKAQVSVQVCTNHALVRKNKTTVKIFSQVSRIINLVVPFKNSKFTQC